VYAKQQYVVPRMDGEVIVGSTLEFEGFDKRTTVEGIRWVLQRAIEMVPGLAGLTFEGARAGIRPYSADSFPILGAFPDVPGLVVATGTAQGILLGPMSGKLLAELILDGTSPVKPSPLRFTGRSILVSSFCTPKCRRGVSKN
jgi:glycine oxidase